MKLYFETKIVLGFLVILTTIVWLSVYSYNYNKRFVATNLWVAHTNEVLFHSEHVLSMLKDLETNQRGYVITGDSVYLLRLDEAKDTVVAHWEKLKLLTRDNNSQQVRLKQLQKLGNDKIHLIKVIIEDRNKSFETAKNRILTTDNRLLMGKIKTIISQFQQEERTLLSTRIMEREKSYREFVHALTALLVAVAVVLIVVFVTIYFALRARATAITALLKISSEYQDLYENAPCGYHSLDDTGKFVEMNGTMLSWLRYKKHEVIAKLSLFDVITEESKATFVENFTHFKSQGSIQGLEFDFVRKDSSVFHGVVNATAIYDTAGNYSKSRSTVFDITDRKKAELKSLQLNQELEAFTYSVSHDLRSPLRSINGYSKIFIEDYGDTLDAEGLRVLNVIMNNATRMGMLIDNLLDFSRVGKKEIVKFPYNAEHMVRSLVVELMEDEKARKININILHLEPSVADVTLLRQVWLNLISNALKYTQKTDAAEIEIGSYRENDQVVYFIKDNGVGFDMQYVKKLFGVFQRLHKTQDFEGTGVGLAIVQRIINRHGGRVWADASLNKGAAFFFSLPIQ